MDDRSYSERQRVEKLYHDQKYREHPGATSAVSEGLERRLWSLIGQPRDLTILDFGCGDGWVSIQLAGLGNRMFGFDISSALIQAARRLAEAAGVGRNTTFDEMAAEDLRYSDATFDLIIGSSILHHTELAAALQNIRRVLKTDGRAVFVEPLNENPVLRIWRHFTPWRRSRTERAFTRDDLGTVRRVFPGVQFTYYGLTSILSQGLLLISPKNRLVSVINRGMERLDERIIRAWPSVGGFSAVVLMQIRK